MQGQSEGSPATKGTAMYIYVRVCVYVSFFFFVHADFSFYVLPCQSPAQGFQNQKCWSVSLKLYYQWGFSVLWLVGQSKTVR